MSGVRFSLFSLPWPVACRANESSRSSPAPRDQDGLGWLDRLSG